MGLEKRKSYTSVLFNSPFLSSVADFVTFVILEYTLEMHVYRSKYSVATDVDMGIYVHILLFSPLL